MLAKRRPGGSDISERAVESAASSVSAAEIKMTSAGVWPKSTGSFPSSTDPGVAASRCIRWFRLAQWRGIGHQRIISE